MLKIEKFEIPLTSIDYESSRIQEKRYHLGRATGIGFAYLFSSGAFSNPSRSDRMVSNTMQGAHLMISSLQDHQNSEMHLDSSLPHHRPRSSTIAHDSTTL